MTQAEAQPAIDAASGSPPRPAASEPAAAPGRPREASRDPDLASRGRGVLADAGDVRIVLVLLALLPTACVAPAHADHRDGGGQVEEPWGGTWDDEQDWSEDWPQDGAAAPAPEAPLQTPEPEQQWFPDAGGGQAQADRLTPLRPTVPAAPSVPLVRTATVAGRVARLRTDGRAAIPRGAPARVRTLIAAMNRIAGKPYKWGGGHGRLVDSGYDCSGAVSYGLIGAGLLRSPLVSGSLAHWGRGGRGRWVTVYANRSHVYLEVAGLRLDTSSVGDVRRRSGVRWRPAIGRRGGFAERHPAGL